MDYKQSARREATHFVESRISYREDNPIHDQAGKACSQLMEAKNTGETKIKLVEKHFRLTFTFNALKTPLNLYLNSLQALSLFLFYEIRGVLRLKHS
jgi:hypothetical protein